MKTIEISERLFYFLCLYFATAEPEKPDMLYDICKNGMEKRYDNIHIPERQSKLKRFHSLLQKRKIKYGKGV